MKDSLGMGVAYVTAIAAILVGIPVFGVQHLFCKLLKKQSWLEQIRQEVSCLQY